MIEKLISLIQENKLEDTSEIIKELSYEVLSQVNPDLKITLIKLIFQKDSLSLYINIKSKIGWNSHLEFLSEEDSLNLIHYLPNRSQIAGYLLFKAIPSNYPIDQLITCNNKVQQLLLSKIISPNIHEEAYETPFLSYFIEYSDLDELSFKKMLDDLIKMGGSLSEKDVYNITPLHIAAKYNKLAYFQPAPQLGNLQDAFGNTPLHYAIIAGHLDTVKQLVLDWKTNVNLSNSMGLSPLMLAAAMGKKEIAQFLLENNANIHHQDKFGSLAIDWAKGLNDTEIVNLFLENHSPSPHPDEFIQQNLAKAAYVQSVSNVMHMGRDSNALLSSFKKGTIFVVNSNSDLSLLLELIKIKANENPSEKFTCAIQINDEVSTHFSVAHLEIKNGNTRSLIVDTISDHSGVGAYKSQYERMFPEGKLLISKTNPQNSRSTCRVFTQDIAEKMIKYGVDYDDLERHKESTRNAEKTIILKREGLPLILGGRTIESISALNSTIKYRTALNDKEVLTNKENAPIITTEDKDLYGVSKKKNVFSRKKFASQHEKTITKLQTMDSQQIQEGLSKSFGFFMVQPKVFDLKWSIDENKVSIVINRTNYFGANLRDLIQNTLDELNSKFPEDTIESTEEMIEKEEDVLIFLPKFIATKQALERLIQHLEGSLKSTHFLDKNEVLQGKKQNFKTKEPLSAEAFLKEIKVVYSLLENPQSVSLKTR